MSYLMQLSFFLKCEESLGMGMIFSVVDAAQQWINENVSPDTSEQPCDNKVNCVCFISYMLLTMHVYSRHSLSTYTLGVGKRRDKWHRTETSQIWRTQTDRRKMAVCHRTCGKSLFYMYMCTFTFCLYTYSGYQYVHIEYLQIKCISTHWHQYCTINLMKNCTFCKHHIILYCGNYLVVTIDMPYHFSRPSISKFMFSNNKTSHKYYKYI